jgi:hypothetical protein
MVMKTPAEAALGGHVDGNRHLRGKDGLNDLAHRRVKAAGGVELNEQQAGA